MIKAVIRLAACIAALFLMQVLFPGQVGFDSQAALLAGGIVLWLLYLLVRPVLQLISFPITFLTLGLFSLVINAGMVKIMDLLLPGVFVHGFWACVGTGFFISLIDFCFGHRDRRQS